MEDVLISMKVISDNINVEDLLTKSFDFNISRDHLRVILLVNNKGIRGNL